MGNPIVSTDLLEFEASTTEEATNHPVTNLELPKAPFRTWRSTTTGTQQIELDLGAEVDIKAMMMHHGNFSQYDVYSSPAAKSYTIHTGNRPFGYESSPKRVPRRKDWLTLSLTSKQYIRVDLENLDSGETYFELGSIILFGTVVTLDDAPGDPRRFKHVQANTRTDFGGGGFEINEDGEPHLEYWVENPLWDRRSSSTVETQLFDILNAGMAAPIAYYENQSDPAKCYLFGRVEEPEFAEGFVTFEMGIALKEYT